MRGFVGRTLSGAVLALATLIPTLAPAEDLVPARRLVLSENTDLPGGDIASVFDTTLEACQRACLTNKTCTAFTFNTRNGSCFAKSAAGAATAFDGAYSGLVIEAGAGAQALARTRRAELRFVGDWELSYITDQAAQLANAHTTNGYSAEDHLASARSSEADGNYAWAAAYTGAALNLTDSASDWAEYARLLLAAAAAGAGNDQRSYRERAYYAAVNAYLRADNPALQHNILVTMGQALEAADRGRDTVQALRLAQNLQPRDDTAAALTEAIGKYGFRIVENMVQTDTPRPRICVNFSEVLVKSGVDYASYVKLPAPGLTVTTDGWQQMCVEGVTYGSRQTITFREGLPAADGQTLAQDIDITAYVRDRNPGVRFPGRGYVLPRTGAAMLPVETVNTETLELQLYKVTDRNLLRALQNGYFGAPMWEYQEYDFSAQIGSEIWSGTAAVKQEVNVDVTTRLPLDEALQGQPAGIYALRAAVPGVDPYVVPASWQWFVVSDLGVTTLSGVDGLNVFVRSLSTAAARPGVSVELLSRANEAVSYTHLTLPTSDLV